MVDVVNNQNQNSTTDLFDKELEQYLAETVKRIKVVGCGGGGSNAISRLYEMGVQGPELIAINTDVRHLTSPLVKAHKKILIGKSLTKGLGAGKDPKVGEEAAKESEQEIKKALEGADVVFLTASLGGGTGGGSIPVVAEIAKKMGAITIAVVTWPFQQEGANIWDNAIYSLERLEKVVDMLVVIPNDKILQQYPNLSLIQAFKAADSILANALRELTELLTKAGYINIDFADFKAIVAGSGYGIFGMGESNSENKAQEAVQRALQNPLVDVDITGARAALIRITASSDITPNDISKVLNEVKTVLDPSAKIIYGVTFDESQKNYMRVGLFITKLRTLPTYIAGIKGETLNITSEESEKGNKVEKPQEIKKLEEELGIEII